MTSPDDRAALTDDAIEKGWHATFSTDNPYCPCNLKSFTKAVHWAERALAAAQPHPNAPLTDDAPECTCSPLGSKATHNEACPVTHWTRAQFRMSGENANGAQPQPGTCAALTDDDILRAAIKHGIGAMPILKGARYSEFTDTERLVLFARTLMRLTASQPQPVNRADSVDVAIALEQQRALHIVQAVRTQGFAKSDTALPTQAESVFDLACEEIGHRLRTEVWELGGVPMPVNRADGDAVPVHDHPSTEAGDYLPIDFGDAVPVAWYIPDDNGAPYRTTGYCGEALEWKMKGKTVLPLYDAPPASTSANAQAPVARPVATLHDDGYYTWNPAVDKPSGYNYAGWRMEVFAAPIASALPTTPIDGKKS